MTMSYHFDGKTMTLVIPKDSLEFILYFCKLQPDAESMALLEKLGISI